ncbi:ADP compounds hydrolase [Escherichia coli]|uniref:ADP compounds hydrolase n=1 Tax=Escherichia coli TaxID=562 RepID=A0A484Y5A7_ECOLX|nr:ADP compounds hydrolase [Escherichia coli]
MSKSLQKPTILNVETVARSRLFTVESVDLEFSNGVRRVYERMRPTNREAVMIVPIVDDHLILIREYAVGTESYELGFSKGLIDPGESVFEAANRELKEEVGIWCERSDFFEEAQHGTVLLFQQNEYRGSARSLPGITGRR